MERSCQFCSGMPPQCLTQDLAPASSTFVQWARARFSWRRGEWAIPFSVSCLLPFLFLLLLLLRILLLLLIFWLYPPSLSLLLFLPHFCIILIFWGSKAWGDILPQRHFRSRECEKQVWFPCHDNAIVPTRFFFLNVFSQ